MGYINRITVGGELYTLTPTFRSNIVYAVDTEGFMIDAYLLATYSNGDLYPNLAIYNDRIYNLRASNGGIICGLGVNAAGALGLYLSGGSAMIVDAFPYGSLARIGMNADGAIGVCTTGTDGIYTNDSTECISLKLITEPVTLDSGEQLKLYINPEGFLELTKV